MAATGSIRIEKTVSWKGGLQTWSNRYFFDGTLPADSGHWTTFADAIVTAEKACHYNGIVITRAVGYTAGSDVSVFLKDYTTGGTFTGSDLEPTPAECVALLRWTTAKRSSKNHPVYLFNYMHGVLIHAATTPDTVLAAQKTAYETYGAAWIAGFSDGAATHHRAGPDGTLAIAMACEPYVTHRDFPR